MINNNNNHNNMLTIDKVKNLLKCLSSSNNNERIQSEEAFKSLKYEKILYEIFYTIITEVAINQNNDYYKIQSLIAIKNIIKPELNINRSRIKILDEENPMITEIINYNKIMLLSVLYENRHILVKFSKYIKELVKLFADKYFPLEWEEFILFVEKILLVTNEEIFSYNANNVSNLEVLSIVASMLSSVLKQHYNKKTPLSKTKFNKVKDRFNNLINIIFKQINDYFINNSSTVLNFQIDLINNNKLELHNNSYQSYLNNTKHFLNLLCNIDKSTIQISELGFNINEFHNNKTSSIILDMCLDKSEYILKILFEICDYVINYNNNNNGITNKKINFNDNNLNNYKILYEALSYNINQNLEYLTKILSNSTAQILFYSCLEKYSNIILNIINKYEYFSLDTIKIASYSLYKIISTDFLKDPTSNYYSDSNYNSKSNKKLVSKNNVINNVSNFDNHIIESDKNISSNKIINSNNNNIYLTPDKKDNCFANYSINTSLVTNHKINDFSTNVTNSLNLVSPIKFKNYESEVKIANETFNKIFDENIIVNIFKLLVYDLPLAFNINSTDLSEASEIENAFDRDDDNYNMLIVNSNISNDSSIAYSGLSIGGLFNIEYYDANVVSWYHIYRTLIESMIVNFRLLLVDIIKNTVFKNLEDYYKSTISYNNIDISNKKSFNFVNSLVLILNLMPKLYKLNIIKEYNMICYSNYFNMLESFIKQNKKLEYISIYFSTIDKWTEVLISYDTIHLYINNITHLLNSFFNNVCSNNNQSCNTEKLASILVEGCFALANIIIKIDNYLIFIEKNSSFSKPLILSKSVDVKSLIDKIKQNINWSDILIIVSKILFCVILENKNDSSCIDNNNKYSAEIIIHLIKLTTLLINKCHFQCQGEILNVLKNSKLNDIMHASNELTQSAFSEMFKALLVSFPKSITIMELSLNYIQIIFNCKVDLNNLNVFLFMLKIIQINDLANPRSNNDINTLLNFFKNCFNIIQNLLNNFTDNYSNHIVFQILEEFLIIYFNLIQISIDSNADYKILSTEEIFNIFKVIIDKLKSIQKKAYDILDKINSYNFMEEEISNNSINNNINNDISRTLYSNNFTINSSYNLEIENAKRFSFGVTSKLINSKSDITNTEYKNYVICNNEINEYKTSLTNLMSSLFIIYNSLYQKNYYTSSDYSIFKSLEYEILEIIVNDVFINQSNITTSYNTALIGLINRIFCNNIEVFFKAVNNVLSKVSLENNILNLFTENWLKKMENTLNNNVRKLNTITISVLLPFLSKTLFFHLKSEISYICIRPVHNEFKKNIQSSSTNNNILNNKNIQEVRNRYSGSIKSILLQTSQRKTNLIEEIDNILKINILNLFTEKFKEMINNNSVNYSDISNDNYFINSGNLVLLNEILGLKKLDN